MPGVREVMGLDPLKTAIEHVTDPSETLRRNTIRRQVDLYAGDVERVLREESHRLFSRERRMRYEPFLRLGGALSLARRIVDELTRVAYSPPPLRTVYRDAPGKRKDRRPGPDQPAYDALTKQCRHNAKMRLACGLTIGATASALHYRVNARLGMVEDVIAGNAMTVIADPADPTRELAVVYDLPTIEGGRPTMHHVYWDDSVAFVFGQDMQRRAIQDASGNTVRELTRENGHPGILPFVVIHAEERSGCYWNTNANSPLVHGSSAVGILGAMMARLLKVQGHKQLAYNGTSGPPPQDQLLDPEENVQGGEGNVSVLYNPTPADHFIAGIEHITNTVAAHYGINRDRLNAQGPGLTDTAGLLERRAEIITIFDEAEQRAFEVMRAVSKQHPDYQIHDDARLVCDFAEISTKVERSKQLDIWKAEIEMGVRNLADCIREDNPEITNEDDALGEIEHNAEIRARVVDLMRKLEIRTDASVGQPGQDPATNGAMGTMVRDGLMTRDDAAAVAKAGAAGAASEDDRALARRYLERIRRRVA